MAAAELRESQSVIEVLQGGTPNLRESQCVIEVLESQVVSPDPVGTGGISIGHPTFSGSGTVIDVVGPMRITQEARETLTAETTPLARLTQMGRETPTAETTPLARLTQMGRQVLYPFTCTDTPITLTDFPIVNVLRSMLLPRWELERYDVKNRHEETAASVITTTYPTVPASDGGRWRLERFDIRYRPEEGLVGFSPTVQAIFPVAASWQLMSFELHPREEEKA